MRPSDRAFSWRCRSSANPPPTLPRSGARAKSANDPINPWLSHPAVSFLHPLDNRAVGAPRELLAQWDLLVRYRQSYTSPGRYPVMCVTHGGADRCRAHCPATRADDNRMCANVRLTVIRPRAPESRGAADSRRSSVREGGIDGVLFTPASSEDRKA